MAWLAGYNYRKKITVAAGTGAGTNYQQLLLVGESAGAAGENFDLVEHCQDFPNDIRFTDNDETTLLDHWLESTTGATPNRLARFWVEVADDLGNNVDVCLYYGKAADSSASNGVNTFPAFVDGVTDESSKFTLRDVYSAGINATLSYDATNKYYRIITDPSDLVGVEINTLAAGGGYEINAQLMVLTALSTNNQIGLLMRYSTSGAYYGRRIRTSANIQDIQYEATPPNTTQVEVAAATPTSALVASTWYKAKANAYGTSFNFWFELDNLTVSGTNTSQSTGTWGLLCGWTSGKYYCFKNVWVRKYTTTEPAYSSAGNEEVPLGHPTMLRHRRIPHMNYIGGI